MLRLNVTDVITLHEGNYNGEEIYYIVKYGSTYTPEVYIYNKQKLDMLIRGRTNISIAEYNTYIGITKICITKFTDSNFETKYKTKARRIEYKY